MKAFAFSLIFLVLTGCSNLEDGPKYKPEIFDKSKNAVVYVYWQMSTKTRIDNTTAFGSRADVNLDFIPIGSMKVGGYISKIIEPGEHFISASAEGLSNSQASIPITFTVEAGQEYYFAFISGDFDFTEDGYPLVPKDKYIFKQIDAAHALFSISKLKSSQ